MKKTPASHIRYPVPLADGLIIESVYYGSGTLCLSSQAGCALSCPFCASGRRGLCRQLTTAELELQLELLRQYGVTPQRLTISGIGEPLHNWNSVRSFMVDVQKRGLGVSLTTTGAALHYLEESISLANNGVMISLHAACSRTHAQLIPNGPKFERILATLEEIYPRLSRRKRRKIGINYLLFHGINDNDEDLLALQAMMQRWPDFTLHLLSYNPVAEAPFHSDLRILERWHDHLRKDGLSVRRPNRWRNNSDGGCGTLFLREGNSD